MAQQAADITLLLEGTYPYVRGGVSSWVHQMIQGLPERRFALIFIGGSPEHCDKQRYALPDNVVHLETHCLQQAWQGGKPIRTAGCPAAFHKVEQLHAAFQQPDTPLPADLVADVLNLIDQPDGINQRDFLYSHAAWQTITTAYQQYSQEPAFLDYFWTVRSMHAPIFMLSRIAQQAPMTPVVHAISTGYGGLLGAFIKRQRPTVCYLLTEHGIYTKERKIDLAQASWISTGQPTGMTTDMGYLRQLWIRFFEVIGQITYQSADRIITIYEGNRLRQIRDGAPVAKTQVIPNGIPLEHYQDALAQRPEGIPPVVGLIGRVVPIKDIKTFIHSLQVIRSAIPEIQGWIVGPEEEDPNYAKACHELVASLALADSLIFRGFQKIPTILPQLGIMVLTSISEAQPLVILEAFAAGVPCVCTDVGACRELIEGSTDPADRALGAAGAVVNMANPEATAAACIALLTDEHAWRNAQQAGLQRVQQFYSEALLFQRYQHLYQQAMGLSSEARPLEQPANVGQEQAMVPTTDEA